jgi:hypothetical protein
LVGEPEDNSQLHNRYSISPGECFPTPCIVNFKAHPQTVGCSETRNHEIVASLNRPRLEAVLLFQLGS